MPEGPNQLPLASNLKARTGASAMPGSSLTAPSLTNPGAIGGIDSGVINGYIDGEGERSLVQKRPGVERVANLLPCIRPRGMFHVSGSTGDHTLVVCDDMLLVDPEAGIKVGERWNQVTPSTTPFVNKDSVDTKLVSFQNVILAIDGPAADVFSTTDGVTWTTLTTSAGWTARSNFGVVATSAFVYVIAGNSGATDRSDVWRSADGASWTQVYSGALPTDSGQTAGARNPICFSNGSNIYWCFGGVNGATSGDTSHDAIFQSTNGGVTWTRAAFGNTGGGIAGGVAVMTPTGGSTAAFFMLQTILPKRLWTWIVGSGSAPVTVRLDMPGICTVGWLNTKDSRFYYYGESSNKLVRVNANATVQEIPSGPGTPVIPSVAVTLSGDPYAIAFNGNLGLNNEGLLLGLDRGANNNVYSAVASRSPANGFYTGLFTSGFTTDDLLQYVSMDAFPPAFIDSRTRNEPPLEGVFIKSRRDAYFFNTSNLVLSHVLDENYPDETVDGVAILNGRVVVATPSGFIFNTEVSNPFDWRAVNVISAQSQPDKLVAIARRFTYIGAFGEQSIEWFQDTGTAQGTPFLPLESAVTDVGCSHGHSIVRMDDTLLFVGRGTRTGDRAVYMLNGYQPTKISTPDVDRLIASHPVDAVAAYSLYSGGHRFYALDFLGTGTAATGGGSVSAGKYTLVYDLETRAWYVWNCYLVQNLGTISSLTRASDSTGFTRVTVTIPLPSTNNRVAAGDIVELRGCTPTAYNGEWFVDTAPSTTTFTFLTETDLGALSVSGEAHLLRNEPLTAAASADGDFGNTLRFPISHTSFGLEFVVSGGDSASRALAYPSNVGSTAADTVYPSLVQLASDAFSDDWLGRPYSVIPGTAETAALSHIETLMRTVRWDGGGNADKFVGHVDLIGDILSTGAKAWTRHSNDDRRSWTLLLDVGLDTDRPRVHRQGRARRRVYDVRFTDTTRTGRFERLEALVNTDGLR